MLVTPELVFSLKYGFVSPHLIIANAKLDWKIRKI